MKQILVVDDEASIIHLISGYLEREGFGVVVAEDGPSAVEREQLTTPDLVILDVMIPGFDGLETCRRIRVNSSVPILMLTAKSTEIDKIVGLGIGADDYLTKPFSPRELVARVNAVLRRAEGGGEGESLEAEGLSIDRAGHRVSARGRAVALGPTEYRLLEFFMAHPDRVYSREQLLDRVWGGNVYVEERTIDVHIRRLRKALEEHGYDRFVQTVRGTGYRFSTRVEAG